MSGETGTLGLRRCSNSSSCIGLNAKTTCEECEFVARRVSLWCEFVVDLVNTFVADLADTYLVDLVTLNPDLTVLVHISSWSELS